MKILIVDNDQNVATTIKSALSLKPEYEVNVCLSAAEALKFLKTGRPDLILMDFMMPEINGVELCKLLLEDKKTKDVPIIMVSALPISSKVFQEANNNFNKLPNIKDLLEKPFGVNDLLGKVEKVLGK